MLAFISEKTALFWTQSRLCLKYVTHYTLNNELTFGTEPRIKTAPLTASLSPLLRCFHSPRPS